MTKVGWAVAISIILSIILFCMVLSVGSGGDIFKPIDNFFDSVLDSHSSEYMTCSAENSYCWEKKE